MSYLSTLQGRLAQLEAQRRSCEKELNVQKQRKKSVEKIQREINSVGSGSCGGINGRLQSAASMLESGIRLGGAIYSRGNEIRAARENAPSADQSLGGALNDLAHELNNIAQKIDELESNRNRLNNEISNVHSQIDSERRRIAEEKLAELAAKLTGKGD